MSLTPKKRLPPKKEVKCKSSIPEFGNKVSFTVTGRRNWVVGAIQYEVRRYILSKSLKFTTELSEKVTMNPNIK
ncbi:MAG: hypothetical protein OXM55_07195, partial [Bdellovibrionales bacterium]|nr:hypothetical protein [Bdellovibrionales bacterium]